jgi:hypothetical protein
VGFHNRTRDCQTEPKALLSTDLSWSAPKTIKHARQKLLANTMTSVGNGDVRIILALRTTEFDTTAGRCKLDGIRQEIRKHLLEPDRVADDRIFELLYLCSQDDVLSSRLWRHGFYSCFDSWNESDRLSSKA